MAPIDRVHLRTFAPLFPPDMKHAKAYTYSPYFAQDPETAEKAFETSPINAFEFEIE